MEEFIKSEVKRTFNPEFLNRLDEVIIFMSLSDAGLIQILELLFQQLNANLNSEGDHALSDRRYQKWILEKTLVNRTYARPFRHTLQRYLEDPFSEALIAGSISERPAFLKVYLENSQLFYRPVSGVARPN